MKVNLRETPRGTIVDVSGDVDLESSTDLRRTLLEVLKNTTPPVVLVNLTQVPYIDSSGIATLVEGLKLSQQMRIPYGLFGLGKNPRSVLELARLHKVFHIFETEQEAVEKLGGASSAAG